MTPLEILLLLAAGLGGGAFNAVVGGGTFVAFPALDAVLRLPLTANATTSFALWPGGLASALAYRKHLVVPRRDLALLLAASLAGGGTGAWLLLATGERAFAALVPWLLLVGTLAFTFGPRFTAPPEGATRPRGSIALAVLIQLAIAVYGGYFGGGMGILMLASWSLLSLGGIHELNALRNVLSIAINGVAIVAFALAGAIAWKQGAVVLAGAAAGGYAGAWLAARVEAKQMRRAVTVLAWLMTAVFFERSFR